MFGLVALFVWSTLQTVSGFYGGGFTYSLLSEKNGYYKTKLIFLNGWSLGSGPCYNNCSENDTASDATEQKLQCCQNQSEFGRWELDLPVFKTHYRSSIIIGNNTYERAINHYNITSYVSNNTRDEVLMISQHDGWEMKRSETLIDIPFAAEYGDQFDIIFRVLLQGNDTGSVDGYLQSKIQAGVRSDTGKLNNGPLTLIKPVYRLEVDRHHRIVIPYIDVDEDRVRCNLANFIEAGSLAQFMKRLHEDLTVTLNQKTCTLHLFPNSTKMHVGDTFDIAFNMKDYPRRNIISDTVRVSDGHDKHLRDPHLSFSSIVYRVHFVVTAETDPPTFTFPPPDKLSYTTYVGSEFTIRVVAKPSYHRHITKFEVIRNDGKPVNFTRVIPLSDSQDNSSFTDISLKATDEDVGKFIICINVEDSLGISSVDMLCLIFNIKHLDVSMIPVETMKSVFLSAKDLACDVDTVCVFPVYVTTTDDGGLKNLTLEMNHSTEKDTTLTTQQSILQHPIITKIVTVEFLARRPGETKICLTARDSKTSTNRCYEITVQPNDPCDKNPCLNGGICEPSTDLKNFTCFCKEKTRGRFCQITEKDVNCEPTPCYGNTSVCVATPFTKPYFMCINCPADKTGYRCQLDIDPCGRNPCRHTEICRLTSSNSYLCLNSRPPLVPGCNSSCVRNSNITCAMDMTRHPSCICAYGLSPPGMCSRDTLSGSSSSIKPQFALPTPGAGSTIACDFGMEKCTFAVYVLSRAFPILTYMYVDGLSLHSPPVVNSTHIPHLWRAVVEFSNPSHEIERPEEYDICLNAEKHHTFGVEITDRRCFHLVLNSTVYREYSKNTTCQFTSAETPQYGSIIGCKRGAVCHFFVYTHPVNGHCNEVYTDNLYTSVFSPLIDKSQNLCTHDVAYTNTSTPGQTKICLKTCESETVRCYTMNVIENDRCSPNPCLNDGICLDTHYSDIKCFCKNETILGRFCEKVFVPDCKSSRKCVNNAGCYNKNETEDVCICRLGYTGGNCQLDANENLTNLAADGGKFQDLAIPSTVQCYLFYPCIIPFTVTRVPFMSPHVVPGYIGAGVEVMKVEMVVSNPPGVVDHGKIEVIGSSLGKFKVCLQSVEERRAAIADERCLTVIVVEGFNLQEDKSVPHFVEPTLRDGGHFQCLLHRPCHLILWAVNDALTKDCPILSADKDFDSGVFILNPLNSSSQPCMYDVVIEAKRVLNISLCFSLTIDNHQFLQYNDGYKDRLRDIRCYTVQITETLSAQGLCTGVTCLNSAMCDGHGAIAKCVCPLGFSGNDCSTEVGLSHADQHNYFKPPLFNNLALPKLYYCPMNHECQLQFLVKSKKSVYITTNSDPTIVQVQTIKQRRVSDDRLATITLLHRQQGSHFMCVTLSEDKYSSETDKACFMVISPFHDKGSDGHCDDMSPDNCSDLHALTIVCADASTAIFCAKSCGLCSNPGHDLTSLESLFVAPTPSNSSTFSCSPGQECHIMLYLKQGNQKDCPRVFPESNSEVTMLHGDDCRCVVDAVLRPAPEGHTQRLCFKVQQISMSESRCFDVVFKKHYAIRQSVTTTSQITTRPATTPNINILSGHIFG